MGVYLQLLPSVLNTSLVWFKSPRSAEAATDYAVKKLVKKSCIQLALSWRKKAWADDFNPSEKSLQFPAQISFFPLFLCLYLVVKYPDSQCLLISTGQLKGACHICGFPDCPAPS